MKIAVYCLVVIAQINAAYSIFCSAYCKPNSCSNLNKDNCNDCDLPFVIDGNKCKIPASSNYKLIAQENDFDISPSKTDNCNADKNYNFNGVYTNGNIQLTYKNTYTDVPHFKVIFIVWGIFYDIFTSYNFQVTFLETNTMISLLIDTSTMSQLQDTNCGMYTTMDEGSTKLTAQFLHSGDITNFKFDLGVTLLGQQWGVKEYMVLIEKCHVSCAICTDATAILCSQCATGYKLSGTICDTSCQPQYGVSSDPLVCILCDAYCTNCQGTATNCSACTPTAPNQAFHDSLTNTCVLNCPDYYFQNVDNHQCTLCQNIDCLDCLSTDDAICYDCDTDAYWLDFECYLDCPDGYFNDVENCTLCDAYCTHCQGTATNCSACTPTAPNQAFHDSLTNTCVLNCPDYYFQNVDNHQCTLCRNRNCIDCLSTDDAICYNCDTHWFDYECYVDCPDGYYNDIRNCSKCHINCTICQSSPTFCSACNAAIPDNFLFASKCGDCPQAYFKYYPNRTCLNCDLHCVTATLDMYKVEEHLETDICFNQPINFNNFPYEDFQKIEFPYQSIPLQRLEISYKIINNTCYKVIIEANHFINITDQLVIISIKPYEKDYYSSNEFKFHESIYELKDYETWSYFMGPSISLEDAARIAPVEYYNNITNSYLALQWVQQIKKTGIFMFLMPGAQLSSTTLLHNTVPPQNMYEAMRFWGVFVYFEVPEWEKNANQTKYLVYQPINNFHQQRRMLQQSSANVSQLQNYWRFSRTGHSTYFILDYYMPLAMVVISLFLSLLGYCLRKRVRYKYLSTLYIFIHKIHEVLMFYLMIGFLLQWLIFQQKAEEPIKYISLATSLVAALYLFGYELFVFYKLIGYAHADINSYRFSKYIIYYSFFLRDLRYEEYKPQKRLWKFCHFFRPYNYKILGFYRLFMIIAALPLFQEFEHASIICLFFIQLIEILRFVVTWPYHAKWRTIYQLSLQILLWLIFIIYIVESVKYSNIWWNINVTTQEEVDSYYTIGWIGFILFFSYNVLFIIYFLIDFIISIKYSNRERVEYSRKQFYLDKIKAYMMKSEEDKTPSYIYALQKMHDADDRRLSKPQEVSEKAYISNLLSKGNLRQRSYEKLQTISIVFEEVEIIPVVNNAYEIRFEKVRDTYMRDHLSLKKRNNILIPTKKKQQIVLKPNGTSTKYYDIFYHIFKKYSKLSAKNIRLRIMLTIDQSLYSAGEKIPIKPEDMHQFVITTSEKGIQEKHKLSKIMEGFPLPLNFAEMQEFNDHSISQ